MTQTAREPALSVCMATYNGSQHITAQIHSILPQLREDDELIVVDDASSDNTADLVDTIDDPRIRLIRGSRNVGYVAAFERALKEATHDLFLLSDQDDVWTPGRVTLMRHALHSSAVVAGNLVTLDGPGSITGPYGQRSWRLRSRDSTRTWSNTFGILVGNRPYYGSAMGLRRDALELALPFPDLQESHDLWLALCGIHLHSIQHLDEPVTARRFHESNQTPQRPRAIPVVIKSRLRLFRQVLIVRSRVRRSRFT